MRHAHVFALALSLGVVWLAAAYANAQDLATKEQQEELKQMLFARYDQQNVNTTRAGIRVSVLKGSGSNRHDYNVNYDHFAYGKEYWPKEYTRRNLLDESTTEEIETSAMLPSAMQEGEMLRVRKFYFDVNRTGVPQIDFYLVALDGSRIARLEEGDSTFNRPFGTHFRFYTEQLLDTRSVEDMFSGIVERIDPYLIPTEEYLAKKRESTRSAEAQRNVTLEPGMSRAEVTEILGAPEKTVTFGAKTVLTYAEITVELEDDKVVDVKTN